MKSNPLPKVLPFRDGNVTSSESANDYAVRTIFIYNARSELVSATKNAENTEYTYAYDPIGYRTSSTDFGTNRTYTANNLNQYTEISTLRAPASPRETFIPQFDDDGNQTLIQTKTGVWSVTYNGENRPIQWSSVASNSSTPNSSTPSLILMSFDRMGRRVQYIETVGVVTNAHRTFVYDNYLQIANSEHTTSNSHLFVWDPTEPVATRPLVWRYGGSAYSYTHDGNKNVSEVVDSAGNISAHYEYAPFGEVLASTGNLASTNRFRFSSEYSDDSLELVYYNYRHYGSVIGRWNIFDIVESNYSNYYSYLNNNVLNDTDYLGRESIAGLKKDTTVLINNEERHVWNCIEFNGRGTKDEYIKHLQNISFNNINIPSNIRSLMAYNLVSKLSMDKSPEACWSIDFRPLKVARTVNREDDSKCPSGYRLSYEFNVSVNVSDFEKHPTCCKTPKELMKLSGIIALDPIILDGGCVK